MAIAPPLARWDSGWYYGIALKGYSYSAKSLQNNVGFYPLYPLITRFFAELTGAPLFETGIAVSLIALLGALWLFADLVRERAGEEAVFFALASLLLFPAAFFLAAFYTESLFLLTTVAAVWSASRKRWVLCGLAGAAACLTRFNGFLIAVPIAAYMLDSARARDKPNFRGALGALGATIAGAALFPFYLWYRWGNALLYLHDKTRGWPTFAVGHPGNFLKMFLSAIWRSVRLPDAGGKLILGLELAGFLIAILSIPWLVRGKFRPEGLYVAATLSLLVFSGNIDGMHRYVLVLFPCFIPLARFLRRHAVAAWGYGLGGACLGVITMTRFIHWMFVG